MASAPRPCAREKRTASLAVENTTEKGSGHPDADWGSVLVAGTELGHDDYQVTRERVVIPGLGGPPAQPLER